MRIVLNFVHKTRNASVTSLLHYYTSKIRPFLPVEIIETKTLPDVEATAKKQGIFFFHDTGRSFTSVEFAQWLSQRIHTSGDNRLEFWCGGPDGFPGLTLPKDRLISLSKMTFSHELARVMICEQIYRALCIINRHPYPK
jgi:23S rRNA (pseudouridine1915-N3)-methyltransferase